MIKLKPLKYREIIKILRKHDFVFRRLTGGSHEIWWNEKTRKTCVVPHHKEIKTGTLMSIIHQTGLSKEKFFEK